MRHHGVRLLALSGAAGVAVLWVINLVISGFDYRDTIIAASMILVLVLIVSIATILENRHGSDST